MLTCLVPIQVVAYFWHFMTVTVSVSSSNCTASPWLFCLTVQLGNPPGDSPKHRRLGGHKTWDWTTHQWGTNDFTPQSGKSPPLKGDKRGLRPQKEWKISIISIICWFSLPYLTWWHHDMIPMLTTPPVNCIKTVMENTLCKLTQLWKITMFNGKIHYKWSFYVIFNSYFDITRGYHIQNL